MMKKAALSPLHDMLDDKLRVFYFKSYLAEVARAVKDGVDVRGYFAWSLLDNLEWAQCDTKCFGLVYVNYKNGILRHKKSSAYWFQRFLKGEMQDTARKIRGSFLGVHGTDSNLVGIVALRLIPPNGRCKIRWRREVEVISGRVEEIRTAAGLQQLEKELVDLEGKASDTAFWDDRAQAQQSLSALTDVKDKKIRLLNELKMQVEEAETIIAPTEEM